MRTFFAILLLIHGGIHVLGFVKAFNPAAVTELKGPITRPAGVLWLAAGLLFVAAGVLILAHQQSWWIVGAIAVLLSQALIVGSWSDARFGTIVNLIALVPLVIALAASLPSSNASRYRAEVEKRLASSSNPSLLTEGEITHLPPLVQRYLRAVGAVGRPKVENVRAVFRGAMKLSPEKDWSDITSRQYNFFRTPARLFHIESSMSGIPFDGLHAYTGDGATMQIKVASLFQVVDARGEEMNQGETVTMFNDMCFLAPSTLIDTAITWEPGDSLTVRARFTNLGSTIEATLFFNEKGELVNFLSNDRFLSDDGRAYFAYPWSTPVGGYTNVDGRKVPTRWEAIWHTPQGEFCYGRFDFESIEYNCREFKE